MNETKKVKREQLTNSQAIEIDRNNALHEQNMVMNGLASALGLEGEVPQLSESGSMHKNLRYYLVSNMRQMLSQAYVELGLVKTIVDIPVDDAIKGNFEITTKQLDEDEIEQLVNHMTEKGDFEEIKGALKWNRLYGGGGLMIVTGQDAEKKLDLNAFQQGDRLKFKGVDMWELFPDKQDTGNYAEAMQTFGLDEVEHFNYYGHNVHRSRVIITKGLTVPSFIRPRLRGWGVSVVETLIRSINQYLKANNLTYEILDEFKLDIFKIAGLTSSLTSQHGEQMVNRRVQLANKQKNYQNAMTMDANDDYIQKQLSFAGIAETQAGVRMQIASDMRMPLTKLFGISSAGFSSGEDDIENYNSMIEATVRTPAKPLILQAMKLRAAELFGIVPDDLDFTYESLRILSSEQEENVKNQKFNRILQARQAGELTREEFREMVNRDKLLPMQMDVNNVPDTNLLTGDPQNPETDKNNISSSTPASATQAPKPKNSMGDDPYNFTGKKVAVVGVFSNGEMLCGQRRDNNKWVCPAGHIESGENEKDAAVREVFEESGIRLLTTDLKPLCAKFIIGKDNEKIALFGYYASIPKQAATSKNDPDKEVRRWKWVKCTSRRSELKYENRHAGYNDVIIKALLENEITP